MTASINIEAVPTPVIQGDGNRKDIPHGLDITDETGAAITDEAGQKIDT